MISELDNIHSKLRNILKNPWDIQWHNWSKYCWIRKLYWNFRLYDQFG